MCEQVHCEMDVSKSKCDHKNEGSTVSIHFFHEEWMNDMNDMNNSRTTAADTDTFPVVPRRDRIHVLREFMLETFDCLQKSNKGIDIVVLDVAGGRGDLSFVLVNADHFNAVVVDPRLPDHDKIATTCAWYAQHQDEAAEQAASGQALARLKLQPPYKAPQHLSLFFEEELLQVLSQESRQQEAFETYWNDTRRRIQKLETKFPSHWKSRSSSNNNSSSNNKKNAATSPRIPPGIVNDPKEAWSILNNVSLVVGFHSDQATDACLDFALQRRLPFCIVPCCVFTATFPHRKTIHNKPVSTYQDYVQYLRRKHGKMRVATLPFHSAAKGNGAGLARNTVLYMLEQDYLSE